MIFSSCFESDVSTENKVKALKNGEYWTPSAEFFLDPEDSTLHNLYLSVYSKDGGIIELLSIKHIPLNKKEHKIFPSTPDTSKNRVESHFIEYVDGHVPKGRYYVDSTYLENQLNFSKISDSNVSGNFNIKFISNNTEKSKYDSIVIRCENFDLPILIP